MKTLALLAALAASSALAFGPNSVSSSNVSVQNTAGNSGQCTANSCVQIDISQNAGNVFQPTWAVYDTVTVQVTGTWSGTITFQASQDEGATWFNVPIFIYPGSAVKPSIAVPISTTTANGNWIFDAGGATTFRAVMSTFSSGAAVVLLEKQQAEQYVGIDAMVPTQNSQNVSYSITHSITIPTSAASIAAVEADGTNRLYLRHLKICLGPGALQTTAGARTLVLFKTTAASSGGSTVTPNPMDAADGAFGGIARNGAITTTPASPTAANGLQSWTLNIPAAATGAGSCTNDVWFGDQHGQMKPPTVAKGVANGLAIADLTGGAGGAGLYIIQEDFTTEPQ